MGKFSDSPYFLLKDFFAGRGDSYSTIAKPIFSYEWPVIWTDRDYVTFEDYSGVFWNLRYVYNPNIPNTVNSYLVGLETNIVTEGNGLYELWVKETEELDAPYQDYGERFYPVILRWKRLEGNNFIFTDPEMCHALSGTYTHSLTGLRYEFDRYDLHCRVLTDFINNNRETYWRKDSIYHKWLTNKNTDDKIEVNQYYTNLRTHDTDIRNYTNSDKIFSYFGDIYIDKTPTLGELTEFRIIFDGLKDYTMRAIPEHQRTLNFRKFTEIFFDQKWHEIYNQIKNIWTLIDPMEVDEDFLGYLSKYYHMFDLITPTLFRQREWVRDLIWLLKRKGSYVEFYVIWRAIANTVNALNIYEKWHEKEIINGIHTAYGIPASAAGDTHVYDGEWQEYIYVEKPEYRFSKPTGGAGIGWYNRYYGLSGESIVNTEPASAFFNYPVKMNANPALDSVPSGAEQSNADINLPIYQVAPEDRVLSTHYKLEIDVSSEPLLPDAIVNQPLWDELWQYWDYLRPVNRVVDYNILIAPITDFSGCWVDLYDIGRAYDRTRLMLDMRTIGGYISVHTTPDPWYPTCSPSGTMSGAMSGTYYGESPSGGCRWYVKHDLNSKYLHTMAVDEEYNQIVPRNVEIVDNSTVIFYWEGPVLGYAILKKSTTWAMGGDPGDTWKAKHYLGTNEVITEAHDVTGVTDLKIYGNQTNSVGTSANWVVEDTGDVAMTVVPASTGDFHFYVPSVSGDSAAWIQPLTSATAVWEVPHHLYYRGVITAVYDWNNDQIHQYQFRLSGIDRAVLEFDSPVAGYAIFIPVANFTLEQLVEDFTDILRNGVTWRGATELNDLSNDTFAVSGEIDQNEIYETGSVYEDDSFIYINVKLGAEISGSFKEFGIYNSHGDLMVYSKSSEIYKPAGTTLVLHFRIEKAARTTCGNDGLSSNISCG